MNWDDPVARYNLINQVGPEKYNELIKKHHEDSIIETVNGYPIFKVQGLFAVQHTKMAWMTLERAREEAEKLPEWTGENGTPSAPRGP
jgi:argonaute-like protein implicated in RNA metabolism and viral defense